MENWQTVKLQELRKQRDAIQHRIHADMERNPRVLNHLEKQSLELTGQILRIQGLIV